MNEEVTCIACVVPPRSGNACIGRILKLLGVDMGDLNEYADDANPKGYWQNDKLLDVLWGMMDLEWFQKPEWEPPSEEVSPESKEEMWQYFYRRIADRTDSTWGFIREHFCLVAPWALELVPCKTKLITITRDPKESVRSFLLYGRPKKAAEKIVESHCTRRDLAFNAFKGAKLSIGFDDLILHPIESVTRLTKFLGISPSDESMQRAFSFLDPKVRKVWSMGKGFAITTKMGGR